MVGTRFELGARGSYVAKGFTLEGRTAVRGARSVAWNEWTLRFDDGSLAFLTESIDGLTLYEEGTILPPLEMLLPGSAIDTGFVVVERGRATRIAQWGEVERAPRSYDFVDLSSRSGVPATIDFGDGRAQIFTGGRVTASELGLTPHDNALGLLVNAPEVSRPKGVELWLPVGDTASLGGAQIRVLGVVSRSLVSGTDGEGARWDEYLLFDEERALAAIGSALRWLVVSDGHFNLVEEIEPGLVTTSTDGVLLGGERYEPLSDGIARVDWASGQLPWEVAIGETSNVKDFVRAPYLLTEERTSGPCGGRVDGAVAWSRGVYVVSDVIAKAFAKRALPRPVGRAPNAPT